MKLVTVAEYNMNDIRSQKANSIGSKEYKPIGLDLTKKEKNLTHTPLKINRNQ